MTVKEEAAAVPGCTLSVPRLTWTFSRKQTAIALHFVQC